MSRSFSIFLALMCAVVVMVAVGVWWVGPKLVSLALVDPQRHSPYVALDFAQANDQAAYFARYHHPLIELVSSENGELLGDYQLVHQMHGRVADAWQNLRGLRFSKATDLVQVLTASPYRLMRASLDDLQTLKLASFDPPAAQWRGVLVIWLLNEADNARGDVLRDVLQHKPSQARLVWDTDVETIDGQSPYWQRVVVVDFAELPPAYEWLRDPQVETQRAIIASRVRESSLLIYQRRQKNERS